MTTRKTKSPTGAAAAAKQAPHARKSKPTGELVRLHEAHALFALVLPEEATAQLGPEATQALVDALSEVALVGVLQTKGHVFNLRMTGIAWAEGKPKPAPGDAAPSPQNGR